MINIRCDDSEKEEYNALLRGFKFQNRKKRNIDILIDALRVYEKYTKRLKARVEKAVDEVWGDA